jgi:hypothetical protein
VAGACGNGTGCACQYSPLESTPDCIYPKRRCACLTFLGAPEVPVEGPHAKGGQDPDGFFDGISRAPVQEQRLRPAPDSAPPAPRIIALDNTTLR